VASFFLVGTAVALSSRDYIQGLAETYRSMLLDAIAELDDAATQRATAMPEHAAQPPSEDTLSTVRATRVVGSAQSARDSADRSEEEAASARPSAGTVASAPGATAPADVSTHPSGTTAAESATPSTASAVPVTDVAQSTHPAAEGYEEQAVDASPPTGTVAPAPTPNAPAYVGAAKMPLAPRPTVAPVRVGPPIPEPKPVRIISAWPDRTPISSAIGSTSSVANALKLPTKRASERTEGSAGIAPASNPSSDLANTLGGKPEIAATPNDAARMPSRLSQPGNRHKRERYEKSTNALKVNAAEADANASAIQSESPESDQVPATAAHAGRL
jgi:hypothetical protein